MTRNINIDLSNLPEVTNKIYYPFYKNKTRYEIFYGGAGSGKSVFIADKIIYRCIVERDHKFLVIRKVANTLKDSVYAELKQSLTKFGLTDFCKFNDTEKTIKLPLFNSEIICKGLDDPEKIKSVQGVTSIWVEEATETTEDDIKQLDRRLRGHSKNHKQLIMSFNPINALHWIKRKFIDIPNAKIAVLKTTYKDNKFLDDEYIEMLESETDKFYFDVYTLGEWGALEGIIFTDYIVEDFEKLYMQKDFDRWYFGVDYSYGGDDYSAYIVLTIRGKEIFIFDEIYMSHTTNNLFIDSVEKVHDKKDLIISEVMPAYIKEFRERGFNIRSAEKGKGSIKAGIDNLKRYKIRIDKRCQNFINEIQLYKWREDKQGVIHSEPVDKNNHLLDALRYATEHLWKNRTSKQKPTKVGSDRLLGW